VTLDFEAQLAAAKLPEKIVRVCLRGDLAARVQELEEQLEAASGQADSSGASLAGDGRRALVEQIEAVVQEMHTASIPFRLRAVSKRVWSELTSAHPPRQDDRRDLLAGYNRDELGPQLIRICVVEPALTPQQWEQLEEVLSPAEYAKLDRGAAELNFEEVSIPFSSAASQNRTSFGSE
jgi:hypothetical protein